MACTLIHFFDLNKSVIKVSVNIFLMHKLGLSDLPDFPISANERAIISFYF